LNGIGDKLPRLKTHASRFGQTRKNNPATAVYMSLGVCPLRPSMLRG
jgi:hypothetical protein